MNIYDIGEEKQINGVWGREVNGRFYTWCEEPMGFLYRELDTDNGEYQHLAYCDVNQNVTPLKYENLYVHPRNKRTGTGGTVLTKYIPKHIKDLENLKRGDIVWVLHKTDRGDEWVNTTFLHRAGENYVSTDVFMPCGYVLSHWGQYHKEVFLKPPFNF